MPEYIDLGHDGVLVDRDDKEAVLFLFDDEKVWIPRSLMFEYDEKSVAVELWFAEKKELEEYEI